MRIAITILASLIATAAFAQDQGASSGARPPIAGEASEPTGAIDSGQAEATQQAAERRCQPARTESRLRSRRVRCPAQPAVPANADASADQAGPAQSPEPAPPAPQPQ